MPWHAETVPGQCAKLWGIPEVLAVRHFDSNAAALRGLAAALG